MLSAVTTPRSREPLETAPAVPQTERKSTLSFKSRPPASLQKRVPAKTIMYLSYGSGMHSLEAKFSLLTAFRYIPPTSQQYRYVVYTDNPRHFSDLGVELRLVSKVELQEWIGEHNYIHRRKTMAIIDALGRYPGDVAFIDCDTYFLKSPALLFKRIGPGRTCLHLLEASLDESDNHVTRKLSQALTARSFADAQGRAVTFSANPPMWNSGVVGINSEDSAIMYNALALIDDLCKVVEVPPVEQFATGHCFAETDISETEDIVFHYWDVRLKTPFHSVLPKLFMELANQPVESRPASAWRFRPKSPFRLWARIKKRKLLRRLGFPAPGVQRSA
jgi:hypothetical protein